MSDVQDGPGDAAMAARPGSLGSGEAAPGASTLHAEMRAAVGALASGAVPGEQRGATTDLSIDEALLLHSIAWEPLDVVWGVSVVSIPAWVWRWGTGEILAASQAQAQAASGAISRIEDECRSVGGHGVVGVSVDVEVHPHHVEVSLLGTAVRPVGAGRRRGRPFVSDLTARDFALLLGSGWEVLGLAFGSSFVYAPRRSAGTFFRQSTQNVELTNFTEAIYAAREAAMERLQSSATVFDAGGVVAVQIREGPMAFASHAVGFTAWGSAVRVGHGGHRYVRPQVVLPLDDAVVGVEAKSLRGG